MKARKDFQPDPESNCEYVRALHASNVLEQLRPIIGEDRVREIGVDDSALCEKRGSYGSSTRSLEDAVGTCLENIRSVRGDFSKKHVQCHHLNLNVPFKERTHKKLKKLQNKLSFSYASVSIRWGELGGIVVTSRYGSSRLSVSAPYSYAQQIDAGLAKIASKLIGPYSDIEESPDGILTARCQYSKMDKHHAWHVHDGYLAWMPHDECIKVKALGENREKAERAARSAARREVLAALG